MWGQGNDRSLSLSERQGNNQRLRVLVKVLREVHLHKTVNQAIGAEGLL